MPSLFRSSFNKSLRIESRPERLAGKPGTPLPREIVERTPVRARGRHLEEAMAPETDATPRGFPQPGTAEIAAGFGKRWGGRREADGPPSNHRGRWIPRGRFAKLEEPAALAAWLASRDCSFTTGARVRYFGWPRGLLRRGRRGSGLLNARPDTDGRALE